MRERGSLREKARSFAGLLTADEDMRSGVLLLRSPDVPVVASAELGVAASAATGPAAAASVDASAAEDKESAAAAGELTLSSVALTPVPSALRRAVCMRLRVFAFIGVKFTPVKLYVACTRACRM
jgi:hypothetical protein